MVTITITTTTTHPSPITDQQVPVLRQLEELAPVLVMAGTMGVCVNFVSYFLIQRTSSLTLKVVTTIRNVGVVFIGIAFFHETVTGQQVACDV